MQAIEKLIKRYKNELESAEASLRLAKHNVERQGGAENEEEAEWMFNKANKNVIACTQKVKDLKQFISDLELELS